jgi:hypothetical protein
MAISLDSNGNISTRSGRQAFDRQMPGYMDRLYREAAQANHRVVSANFLALCLKVCGFMLAMGMLLYLAADFYGDLAVKRGNSAATTPHRITIGRDDLTVPENFIRFSSQRQSGSLERLDLYAHWPDLEGFTQSNLDDFESLEDDAPIIFLSLERRGTTEEMSGRVGSIYSHFFAGPPVDAGYGLIRRPFRKDSAYFSEDLFFEAENPYPYATRCIRVTDKVAAPFCMRDIHLGKDLSVTYRFHSSLLPDWMALDRAVRTLVKGFLARS